MYQLVSLVSPGDEKRIGLVKQMWKGKAEILPAAEVIFDSTETAVRVRKGFVERRKEGIEFGKISMANIVTLATRVCVDILHAIVDQFSTEGKKMFVRKFAARPVLIVKTNVGGSTRETGLTFVDAVLEYGKSQERAHLERAYARAFRNQLEQTFVLLCYTVRNVGAVGGAIVSGDGGSEAGFRLSFGLGSKGSKRKWAGAAGPKRTPPPRKKRWDDPGSRGRGRGRGRWNGGGKAN